MVEIHTAVERGQTSRVEELVRADRGAVASRDASGDQPLHIAAWQRKVKIAEFLLDNGADINARGDSGRTPLLYAIENSAKSVIKLLLDRGADPNIKNDFGIAPLYAVASVGDKSSATLLLRKGATKDPNSRVYLDGPAEVLQELMAKPEALQKAENLSLLLWDAIRTQSSELASYLLDHGANPNLKCAGLYPIHHAISFKLPEIVRLLLEHGADITVKDHVGRSMSTFAELYGADLATLQILKETESA